MSSMYLTPSDVAERLNLYFRTGKNKGRPDAPYVIESIMPQLKGVIRLKRAYRIPLASVVEFERLHLCTPESQSVAVSDPDLNKNKITE